MVSNSHLTPVELVCVKTTVKNTEHASDRMSKIKIIQFCRHLRLHPRQVVSSSHGHTVGQTKTTIRTNTIVTPLRSLPNLAQKWHLAVAFGNYWSDGHATPFVTRELEWTLGETLLFLRPPLRRTWSAWWRRTRGSTPTLSSITSPLRCDWMPYLSWWTSALVAPCSRHSSLHSRQTVRNMLLVFRKAFEVIKYLLNLFLASSGKYPPIIYHFIFFLTS